MAECADCDYDYVADENDKKEFVAKSLDELEKKYPKYRGLKGQPLPPPPQKINDWIIDVDREL